MLVFIVPRPQGSYGSGWLLIGSNKVGEHLSCLWPSGREAESVWYLWKRLQVALCMYMQVTPVQCVGTLQTLCFIDAMSFLRYSILL